jgi:phosphate transport system substrate-binding protein
MTYGVGGNVKKFRRPRVLVAGFGALVLTVVGAGSALAQDSGGINISGSSTVEPITSLIGELYGEKHPDVAVRVDGPGTGDGFKLFCAGETDISDASRPIKDPDETSVCEGAGIEYTELPIGLDGLTVIVNKKSNLKMKCLSQEDLYAIFGPESTGDLADATALASELGSTPTFKATGTVKKFTPGPESGTYDAFIELGYQDILDERVSGGNVTDTVTDDSGETVAAEPIVSDGQFPNDNDTVKRVASAKNGIGFLGISYFLENQDKLKSVAIMDPDSGKCVKPTIKTVQDGTYLPLSRTLYIYVNNAKVADNPDLKSFVDFYMSNKNLNGSVKQAGYAPLHKDDQQSSIDTWKQASE